MNIGRKWPPLFSFTVGVSSLSEALYNRTILGWTWCSSFPSLLLVFGLLFPLIDVAFSCLSLFFFWVRCGGRGLRYVGGVSVGRSWRMQKWEEAPDHWRVSFRSRRYWTSIRGGQGSGKMSLVLSLLFDDVFCFSVADSWTAFANPCIFAGRPNHLSFFFEVGWVACVPRVSPVSVALWLWRKREFAGTASLVCYSFLFIAQFLFPLFLFSLRRNSVCSSKLRKMSSWTRQDEWTKKGLQQG